MVSAFCTGPAAAAMFDGNRDADTNISDKKLGINFM
jgi:hypothetical protein